VDVGPSSTCSVFGGRGTWSVRVKVGRTLNKGNGHLSRQEQKVSTVRNDDNTLPNDAVLEDEDMLDQGTRRVTNKGGDKRASHK
jgi:hypothetical protein